MKEFSPIYMKVDPEVKEDFEKLAREHNLSMIALFELMLARFKEDLNSGAVVIELNRASRRKQA